MENLISRNFFIRSYNISIANKLPSEIDIVVQDLCSIVDWFKKHHQYKSFSIDDIIDLVKDYQFNTNHHILVKAKSVWWNLIQENDLFRDIVVVSYKDCPPRFAFYIEKVKL